MDKSLVSVTSRGRVWMHDLIQEMCWEIVLRQQSIKNIGEQSRLWFPQDVYHVLDNGEGTKAIEGIYLDMYEMKDDLYLKATVFKDMHKLRLLKIYVSKDNYEFKVKLIQGLQFLPHSLRYLYWYNYPSKSLPSDYKAQNLVELNMPNSNLKQLWNGVQNLPNFKHINLSFSKQLVKVPDLSQAAKLECITLNECTSLVEISPLDSQRRLQSLDLCGCTNIKSLPKISEIIKNLYLDGTGIKELPSSIGSFENLVKLFLSQCQHIKYLPALPRNLEMLVVNEAAIKQVSSSSIESLHRLELFYLAWCKKLESLPINIFKLKSLRILHLGHCSRLKKFTEYHSNTSSLQGTGIQETPSFIMEKLFGLRRQDMRWRRRLEFVPNRIYNLSCLKLLSLHGCLKLEHLQMRHISLFSLGQLFLHGCNIVEIPDWLGLLSSLKHLHLGENHPV